MRENEKGIRKLCGIIQHLTGVSSTSGTRHHPLTGSILAIQLYAALYSGMIYLQPDELQRFLQIAAAC